MRLPLTLCPRASPALQLTLAAGHVIAAAVLGPTDLPLWLKLSGWLLLAGSATHAIFRLRRDSPKSLILRSDGHIDVEFLNRGRFEARVDRETTVLPWLVVLWLDINGRRRVLPIASDALSGEEFRRLRLWLRWRSLSEHAA